MSNATTQQNGENKMKNATVEKKTFWYNTAAFALVATLFFETIKNSAFKNARLVFNGETRKINGRTEYSPAITEFGFEVVCDVNDHTEIPGHRFVGIAENKGPGWIVTKFAEDFEFSKEVIDSLDPQRCDVCGHRRNRIRLMVLENTDTKEIVIVGGSCAKNFCNVNLENLVRKMTQFNQLFLCMDSDEMGGWSKGRIVLDLVESIAVAELLISRLGYTSKKKADMNFTYSTADLLADYFAGKERENCGYDAGSAYKAIEEVMDRSKLDLARRMKQLQSGGLKALQAGFERKNETRWSEFNHNMIVWLSCGKDVGSSVPLGVAAYLASINLEGAKESDRTDQKVTGFDGAPVKKMADFGWFKVANVRAKEGYNPGDTDFCYTLINVDNQKLWVKIGEYSAAQRAFDKIVPSDGVDPNQEIWVSLRGKLGNVKSEIAFASHIKFKAVEIRTN